MKPTDTPERRRRDQDELFHLLVDQVRDYSIFLVDPQGYVVSWNLGAQLLKGYTAEEIIGCPFERFYTEEDREAGVPAKLLAAARAEGRVETEGWRVKKDGSRFWADVVITALHDADGELKGYAKISRDLTVQRQSAEALSRAHAELAMKLEELAKANADLELFHLLVDRVRDYAIFYIDPTGRVASWNAGAALLKGYAAEEIIGQSFERFYGDVDRAAGLPAKLLAKAKMDGRVETEGWRYRKDGTRFWADVVITALWDSSGNLRGYAKVTRDLTNQRQAAEALRQAHAALAVQVDELARSNADLEQFAYVASHDLQEPLRMIMTHVQLLVQEYGGHFDAQAKEYVDFVLEGGRRMQRLIKDLLAYSRVVRTDHTMTKVECEGLLRQALQNLDIQIMESQAVVTHGPLPALHGVPSQLIQLFQNLIANAIKFRGSEAPKIHISAVRSGDEYTLVFQDNGIGIDARYAAEIFKPFRRLHGPTQYPGSGIGLAICQKVAAFHGGRIWVESAPGQGARFMVALKEEPPRRDVREDG